MDEPELKSKSGEVFPEEEKIRPDFWYWDNNYLVMGEIVGNPLPVITRD